MNLAKAVACLAVLALLGGLVFTQEAADDKKPTKKAADKAAAEKPATHKVEKKPFKIERTVKGMLGGEEAVEISYRPQPSLQPPPSQGPLTIASVAEHGAAVKKGDVLAAFDGTKLGEAIDDVEKEKKVLEAGIKLAEEELPLSEKSAPTELAAAETAKQRADEALKYFLDVDKAQTIKSTDMMVKSSKFYLEYAQEELRQLEKMYKANDLTEETEKIILRRQQNYVEMAGFYYQMALIDRDYVLKFSLPHKETLLKEAQIKQEQQLDRARKTLGPTLSQKRVNLAKMHHDLEKNASRLGKMRKDRDALTVRSPIDGIVFHGKFHKGHWTLSDAQEGKLVPHGTVMPDEVFLTVVKPRPLVVHLTIDEKDRHLFKADLPGTVKVAFAPQRKLRARVTKLAALPASPGKYDAQVALETGPYTALMPGMACTVHFVPYTKKEAIAVPSKAVHEEDDKYFVYVVPKNGKEERREVTPGRVDDEQTEIISGLREGDEILLERPGHKGAGKKGPAAEKEEGGDR